jgi:prepilin signal peptidase PulO-like enzyme (type II secretory pathway)
MIFLAAVAGLSFALGAALVGRSLSSASEIRFGPFLATGAFLVWLGAVTQVPFGYLGG